MSWFNYVNNFDHSQFAFVYRDDDDDDDLEVEDDDIPSCFLEREIRGDLTTPQKMILCKFMCALAEAELIDPNHGEQSEIIPT